MWPSYLVDVKTSEKLVGTFRTDGDVAHIAGKGLGPLSLIVDSGKHPISVAVIYRIML